MLTRATPLPHCFVMQMSYCANDIVFQARLKKVSIPFYYAAMLARNRLLCIACLVN
jgi:hypothetical protein